VSGSVPLLAAEATDSAAGAIRLGLRANLGQFVLLVAVNALVGGDALGRRLEQDVDRVAEEAPGPRDDEDADDHRRDRIGRRPTGGCNDDGRDDDGDRSGEVTHDLEIGAAYVQAFALGVAEQQLPPAGANPTLVGHFTSDQVQPNGHGRRRRSDNGPARIIVCTFRPPESVSMM